MRRNRDLSARPQSRSLTRRVALITREFQPRVSVDDAPDTPRGGIARAMSMHAHALAELGLDEVHVITLSAGAKPQSFRDGPVHVHRVVAVPIAIPRDMLYIELASWSHAVATKYAELDAEVGFDVVETPDWHGEALHLPLRRQTALVTSLHSLSGVIGPHNGRPWSPGARVWDGLELLALERADHVIAPTQLVFEDSYALLRDRMPPASLVPLPFDAERFPAREGRPARSDALTVAFVGRIERRKGTDLVLRVAAEAKRRGLRLRLRMLGRPDPRFWHQVMEPLLDELELPEIEWHGELSERAVADRVRESDCVILPSRWDNFHMAAVEAMSSGVPVITTDRNGLAGWFERDTGLLALPVADEAAFVTAAVDALTDDHWFDTAGAAAAARVRELCNPTAVARQVLAVYDHLVQSRTGASGRGVGEGMPPSPSIPTAPGATSRHREALQAFGEGRHDDARRLALRGMQQEGTVTRLNDLAVMLAQAGRHEEAKALLAACLVITPDDADALANLAFVEQIGRAAPSLAA